MSVRRDAMPLLREGMAVADVARRLGVPYQYVYQIKRKYLDGLKDYGQSSRQKAKRIAAKEGRGTLGAGGHTGTRVWRDGVWWPTDQAVVARWETIAAASRELGRLNTEGKSGTPEWMAALGHYIDLNRQLAVLSTAEAVT